MTQEINAVIQLKTSIVDRAIINSKVHKCFGGNFKINSIDVNKGFVEAIIKINVTTQAHASLGNVEVVENLLKIVERNPFISIENKVLSLREEAEIYGNV